MKETFADRLKAAMEQRGLKQVDLIREAEKAGVKLGKSHQRQNHTQERRAPFSGQDPAGQPSVAGRQGRTGGLFICVRHISE